MNIVSRRLSYYFSVCFSLSLSLFPFFPFFSPSLLSPMLSLSVIIPIIRLSVCLSFCLSVWSSARSFCSSVYFPTACNSLLTLKRKNRNSVSFSFCDENSNGNNWRGHVFRQKDEFSAIWISIWSAIFVTPELLLAPILAKTTKSERHSNA